MDIVAAASALAGTDPTTLVAAATVAGVYKGVKVIGRLIPNEKKGFWGFARGVAKAITIDVKDRD